MIQDQQLTNSGNLDKLTENERYIWAAGYFDGEASFFRSSPRSHGVRIAVMCTDLDILQTCSKWFGGRVAPVRDLRVRKPLWQWGISGDRAVSVMKRVLPYLHARRAQRVKELLEIAACRISNLERGRRMTAARVRNRTAIALLRERGKSGGREETKTV